MNSLIRGSKRSLKKDTKSNLSHCKWKKLQKFKICCILPSLLVISRYFWFILLFWGKGFMGLEGCKQGETSWGKRRLSRVFVGRWIFWHPGCCGELLYLPTTPHWDRGFVWKVQRSNFCPSHKVLGCSGDTLWVLWKHVLAAFFFHFDEE